MKIQIIKKSNKFDYYKIVLPNGIEALTLQYSQLLELDEEIQRIKKFKQEVEIQ